MWPDFPSPAEVILCVVFRLRTFMPVIFRLPERDSVCRVGLAFPEDTICTLKTSCGYARRRREAIPPRFKIGVGGFLRPAVARVLTRHLAQVGTGGFGLFETYYFRQRKTDFIHARTAPKTILLPKLPAFAGTGGELLPALRPGKHHARGIFQNAGVRSGRGHLCLGFALVPDGGAVPVPARPPYQRVPCRAARKLYAAPAPVFFRQSGLFFGYCHLYRQR